MVYSISAIEKKDINFAPETAVEEILQNVWVILNTMEYDCPLARGLGLNATFLDRPIETSKALGIADIYEKIELYEPRAKIRAVNFEENHDIGRVFARVEVEINENQKYPG